MLIRKSLFAPLLASLLISALPPVFAASAGLLVDDFSQAVLTTRDAARLVVTDQGAGGHSTATQRVEAGVLKVQGQLAAARGAPAWVSVPLLLTADGRPQDQSARTGVRIKVKLLQGNLSVQACSADVPSHDAHIAPVLAARGEFVEVLMPFKAFARPGAEQSPLNTQALKSLNLVAWGLAPGPFAFEVDEIGFY